MSSSILSPREKANQERIQSRRNDAVKWAQGVMTHPDSYLILDTETTGLRGDVRIVNIALLRPDGKAVVNAYLNPEIPIPEEAFNCHHISNEMVKDKPTFAQVADKLITLLKDVQVIAWNSGYDAGVIDGEIYRTGILAPIFAWQDAMDAYARFSMRKGSRVSLQRAIGEVTGTDKVQEHRALGDCRDALKVIEHMANAIRG